MKRLERNMQEDSIYNKFNRFYFSVDQDEKFDNLTVSDKAKVASTLALAAVLSTDLSNLKRLTDVMEGQHTYIE